MDLLSVQEMALLSFGKYILNYLYLLLIFSSHQKKVQFLFECCQYQTILNSNEISINLQQSALQLSITQFVSYCIDTLESLVSIIQG